MGDAVYLLNQIGYNIMNKKDIISLSTEKLKILYNKSHKNFIDNCKLYNLPIKFTIIKNITNKKNNKYIGTITHDKNISSKKKITHNNSRGNIYKQKIPVHIINEMIEEAKELKIMEKELKLRHKNIKT